VQKKRCACAWGGRRERGDHDFRVLAHAESVTFLLSISRCGITRPSPRGGGAAAPGPKRLGAPAGFSSIVLGHISCPSEYKTFGVGPEIRPLIPVPGHSYTDKIARDLLHVRVPHTIGIRESRREPARQSHTPVVGLDPSPSDAWIRWVDRWVHVAETISTQFLFGCSSTEGNSRSL
jgi:hypothetical protein